MIATIPVPPFADVPAVPGVPPMLRSPLFPTPDTPPAVGSDGPDISSLAGQTSAQWGIFDTSNNPVVTSDTVVAFDFKHEFTVVDYPIEDGGFASYNKVARPYEPRFTMAQGGSVADRNAFVTALEAALGSQQSGPNLTLYNVVTPEYTWLNANVVHWDTKRTSTNGVTLITAEIWLREIRVAPAPAFSQTKTPSGQSPANGGTVQAQTPTPAQAADAQGATVPGPDGS